MRIFVIRDFFAPTVRSLVEGICELYTQADSEPIEWNVPGIRSPLLGGEIARDIVARGIREADHVIALLDNPNANVGWEVGLALGWGKSLQLGFVGIELPPWTQIGALKNLVLHHLSSVGSAPRMLARLDWDLKPVAAAQDEGRPLLLCPGGPEGSALRMIATRDHPQLATLPEEGWGLYDVPGLLSGCGRVIWVVANYPEKADVRDGAENASNGVIAGLAEGWGRKVTVLRSDGARVVADVQPRERKFKNLGEFRKKLGDVLGQLADAR